MFGMFPNYLTQLKMQLKKGMIISGLKEKFQNQILLHQVMCISP